MRGHLLLDVGDDRWDVFFDDRVADLAHVLLDVEADLLDGFCDFVDRLLVLEHASNVAHGKAAEIAVGVVRLAERAARERLLGKRDGEESEKHVNS